MLRFEMKKIFSKTVNKIVLCFLGVLILLGSFLTIKNVKYVEKDGTEITGFTAARKLREEQNRWKGELTEEVLREVAGENHKILAEVGNIDDLTIEEEQKAYAKTQNFLDIRELINDALVGFGEYDYYKVDGLDGSSEVEIYEKRISQLKTWLETGENQTGFSEKDKEFLIQKWGELEKPFYYEYASGWIALLKEAQIFPTLLCILVAVTGFLTSGIFSDEFICKSDAIFFSARFGRNRAVAAKIGAGVLTTTIVYWGAVLTYTLITLGILGFGGANVPIQLVNWKSMYNLTFIQEYLLCVIGGYVGSLFIIAISMFVSARTKSSVIAIATAFVLSCVPVFLGRIPIVSKIINFFPDILLRVPHEIDQFLIYNIGGKTMELFSFLIPIYMLLSLLILPILYQVYKRMEVK